MPAHKTVKQRASERARETPREPSKPNATPDANLAQIRLTFHPVALNGLTPSRTDATHWPLPAPLIGCHLKGRGTPGSGAMRLLIECAFRVLGVVAGIAWS